MSLVKFAINQLPPSVNEHRKGWRNDYAKVRWFQNCVYAVLHDLGLTDQALGGKDDPLYIEIAYLFGPRARASDTVSNREKAVLDALKHAGVITDDRWIRQGLIISAEGPTDMTYVKLRRAERPTQDDITEWFE